MGTVKIIRCKDCIFSKTITHRQNNRLCQLHITIMSENDFCSYGKIKDEYDAKNIKHNFTDLNKNSPF